MKSAPLAAALILACSGHAFGWGQEGHSIVAEIAQQRLDADTLARLNKLLGGPISLASFASWADDFRAAHHETEGWHFVDIPHDSTTYDAGLGLARAVAVVQVLRSDPRLNNYTLLPLSGGQLIGVDDQLTLGGGGDDRERRRIEIRLRRANAPEPPTGALAR